MGLDRKRKMSINAPKSSEKKKKSIVDKKSSSDDSDEHSDNDNRLINEIQMGLDRNRKMSINAPKNSEKKQNSLVEKSSSSEDSDEHSDNNGLIDEVKNEIPVINRWPQNDIKKLLSQIEVLLPKNDNSTFRNRVTKLDWEKIQFDNYSKDECHSTWLAIQDQLRTFKTLGDLVNDAKALLATKGIDTYQSKQNRVQKPRSAYMLYYIEVLPKYRKKHPDLKLTQLTQIIAEKYKTLSPEKKQSYLDAAQRLKTEYQELIDKTNEGFKPGFKPSSKPKTSEINKPKTPFHIFLETKTSSLNGQFDKVELQNHFKEKWENMSEKKKSKWIKLAKEREQIYFNNLKEDHKNDPAFVMPPKRALTKGDRNILESQSGKPKKPPTNNYGLFSKEMLQSDALNGVQPKDRMALLAQKWKSFSDEEKQLYTDRLKVLTERYKTEYAAYLKTLPEEERQIELAKNKTKPKKPESKVVPRINAREPITTEKPKKKAVSKPITKLNMFENEPKPVPFKNAFELYRSKLLPNEKHPIKSLEEWEKKNGRKKIQYEEELKSLKKEYMINLKAYLSSLSEEDLKIYLQARKPELLSGNIANNDSDDSSSESENENSSSEEDDEDDTNDDDDDDDSDTD